MGRCMFIANAKNKFYCLFQSRKMKLRKVLDLYELVINEASSLCHGDYNSTYSREMVLGTLKDLLKIFPKNV